MFTFVTSSKTGRRAVVDLLRHYDRTHKAHPDAAATFLVNSLASGCVFGITTAKTPSKSLIDGLAPSACVTKSRKQS
jgi:hypothetical protein